MLTLFPFFVFARYIPNTKHTHTHRFGADAVFRCKDTVMSDQDLDAVLERGAKKTKDMQSKLNVAEKGDMLDFSFDDGTGVQVGTLMPPL